MHEPAPDRDTYPRWVRIHSYDMLEDFYKSLIPKIREAARKCGYAIGIHGSMRRDLDLIAVPWVADHSDKDTLAREIARACTSLVPASFYWGDNPPKPCGRVATSFAICWTEFDHPRHGVGHIDLSVTPDTDEINRPVA